VVQLTSSGPIAALLGTECPALELVSTDGKLREFTDKAEVDLEFVVEKHAEDIANGENFVRGQTWRRGPCLRIPQLADRRAISRLC
jgi:hypothetical protein